MHSKVMRFLALVILLGMVTPQTGSAQIDDLSALDRQFHQLYRQGYYAKAARIAKRAAALAEKKIGPDHPNVATALNNLAEMYRAQGRYAGYRRQIDHVRKPLVYCGLSCKWFCGATHRNCVNSPWSRHSAT
jgi:hypothetical protein